MAKVKTYTLTIPVTGNHVRKGICQNTNKCAIAQALVNNGFRAVSVSSEIEAGRKLDKSQEFIGGTLEFPLSKTANKFIQTFDEIENADDPKATRTALAAKLDAKPLTVKVKLTDEEAKYVLTAKAYKALTAPTETA